MNLTIEEIHEQYEPSGDFEKYQVLATDMGGDEPILVRYKNTGEEWKAKSLHSDFSYFSAGLSDFDLIPKEERVTGWVNVYKDENGDLEFSFRPYPSHDEAFNNRKQIDSYFATIRIDVKRGE